MLWSGSAESGPNEEISGGLAVFGLFRKDPLKKLEKNYRLKLEEARDLQRAGNIQGFAQAQTEAEALRLEIERLKQMSS